MIFYPPTTPLPYSPPYRDYDEVVATLCDICLRKQYDESLSEPLKQQFFDLTMELMEFWYVELEVHCDDFSEG